jgi:hypothetical protein
MQENKKPSGTLEDISRKVATPPHLLPLATFVTMFSRLHCLYILTYYGGSRAELGSQTVRCGVLLLPCVRLAFVTLSPRATAPAVAGCRLVGCSVVSGRPLRSRAVAGGSQCVCVGLGPVLASRPRLWPTRPPGGGGVGFPLRGGVWAE